MVVDYGLGNLHSVCKALEKSGATVRVSNNPDRLDAAAAVVLPGVGTFDEAVGNLEKKGFFKPLAAYLQQNRPFLGICLGFQLLFSESAEGSRKGFGVVPEKMIKFPRGLKTPHIGWNQVTQTRRTILLNGIANNAYFYFVHSYCGVNRDYETGQTQYGVSFTSVLQKGCICATQFHPEKSGPQGLRFLKNFVGGILPKRGGAARW